MLFYYNIEREEILIGRLIKLEDRLGKVSINRFGNKMEVVEYNNAIDIKVKFFNSNEIVHTTWQSFMKGSVKSLYDKTVFNIGYIGEGNNKVTINGNYTLPYKSWSSMLQRCYDEKFLKSHLCYKGVNVCDEWHNFQNFSDWFNINYYELADEQMHLDKDILIKGNKVYSPDTCVFVPQRINCLFVKNNAKRGNLPIGVLFYKNKYISFCRNDKGEQIYLGLYNTPEDAFSKYKIHKEETIQHVANSYKNKIPSILYDALINYKVEITD